jgi:hypothetical protein
MKMVSDPQKVENQCLRGTKDWIKPSYTEKHRITGKNKFLKLQNKNIKISYLAY